jgi:hypothetical protein
MGRLAMVGHDKLLSTLVCVTPSTHIRFGAKVHFRRSLDQGCTKVPRSCLDFTERFGLLTHFVLAEEPKKLVELNRI